MPVTLEEDDASCTLRLEGAMEISLGQEFKTQLLHALGSKKRLHILLADVTEIDITIIQLLWAAKKEAHRTDQPIHLNGPISEHLASALRVSGLDSSLEIAA